VTPQSLFLPGIHIFPVFFAHSLLNSLFWLAKSQCSLDASHIFLLWSSPTPHFSIVSWGCKQALFHGFLCDLPGCALWRCGAFLLSPGCLGSVRGAQLEKRCSATPWSPDFLSKAMVNVGFHQHEWWFNDYIFMDPYIYTHKYRYDITSYWMKLDCIFSSWGWSSITRGKKTHYIWP